MRILALTNLYPNPFQPLRGTFNRQQFRALADRHEVAIISPISWTDEWSARMRGTGALPKGRQVWIDGLDIRHPTYLYTPRLLRRFYGHFMRASLGTTFSRMLHEFRPDLILSAWAYPDGWAAVEMGHRAGLPVVVKIHGSDVLTLPHTPGRGQRTAEALRRADAVIAVSKDLARAASEMGAHRSRVSVVYDGINPELFHPGAQSRARTRLQISGEGPVLLFVGNLLPVKGVDVLLDAVSQLQRRGLSCRLFIIGQGPLRPALEHQTAALNLRDQVTFVGPVRHELLPDWYRASNLFVLPSYSEGVPCVLLEAAACRTPFVASRVGGIPEIAHLSASRLFTAGKVGELASAIEQLLLASPLPPPEAFSRSHEDAARDMEAVFHGLVGTPDTLAFASV